MILRQEKFNIFDEMNYENLKNFRERVIDNILATDMKRCAKEIKALENKLD